MTEREKALSGLLYDAAHDSELMQARDRAKALFFAYNQTPPGDMTRRRALLKELLASCGDDIVIEQPFFCDYGTNIRIGSAFFSNFGCVMLDPAQITIGDRVMFGPDVGLYTAGHPLDAPTRASGLEFARPIVIGDDVWLGGGVRVMPGVTIGNGAVIGSGSVVTRDIPTGVLAYGNPCRVIREILGEEII